MHKIYCILNGIKFFRFTTEHLNASWDENLYCGEPWNEGFGNGRDIFCYGDEQGNGYGCLYSRPNETFSLDNA